MKILIAGSECAPYLKTGGLGDVLGALPKALASQGHEVKLFLPKYRDLSGMSGAAVEQESTIVVGATKYEVSMRRIRLHRGAVEIVLVGQPHLFDRPGLYLDNNGVEYPDNDERFILFCKAILSYVQAAGWAPDIIHAHDWQAALLPVYLKTVFFNVPAFDHCRSILTIHNLAYQGNFPAETFAKLGLDAALFFPAAPLEFYGQVNFLKAGISFADHITTVSPTYAKEIQSGPELGCGLEGVLRNRAEDVTGILNGVDYGVWSPSRDKKIPHRYHKANLSGKRANKVELLNRASLPIRENTPLIGMISRLVDQKGFDLIADGFQQLMSRDLQLVLLGTGEVKYHTLFETLERRYPDRFKAFLAFDDSLAHLIEAAADMFLMPSRFEPCGLNQMYSLKYGTVPIVRRTGGLADSVVAINDRGSTIEGCGFLFDKYDIASMMGAIDEALHLFARKRRWTKVMKNGMAVDHSWERVAEEYTGLFLKVHAKEPIPCA